ncbi:hypothetical protein N9937_01465 [bacterium]|nr:hypothetical protein [bacterium]
MSKMSFEVNLKPRELREVADCLDAIAVSLEATAQPVSTEIAETPPPVSTEIAATASLAPTLAAVFTEAPAKPSVLATLPPPPAEEPEAPKLDAAGFPFSDIIHGSGKKFYASGKLEGKWKLKRGIDPAMVTQIESEMVAAGYGPADATPPPPVADATPPPPVADAVAITYPLLINKISEAVIGGLFTRETCDNVLKEHGIGSLGSLAARQDLLPTINHALFS